MSQPKDCTCASCVNACKTVPGWFAPGEAEKAAAFLNMPFEEFRDKHLIREYWCQTEGDLYVYAPRRQGVDEARTTASYGSAWRRSPCVFLKNNRCTIHPVKPMECRLAGHTDSGECSNNNGREVVVRLWQLVPPLQPWEIAPPNA